MSDSLTLWTLFSSSFLASTLLPGGSELVLGYSATQTAIDPYLLWAVATLGNTLGGLSSWVIGWWLGTRFPTSSLNPQRRRAVARIRRHGAPALLLSWVPLIGDPLCLAAGWLGVRLLPSLLYIAIGKGLRYALLLFLIPLFIG